MKKRGFTLIELLIVMAIIVILAALTMNYFGGYRQSAVLKYTQENILSNIAEAKLQVKQGKKGQDNTVVCFGVLLEKGKNGVTFLQWPYDTSDYYQGKILQTGKCKEAKDVKDAEIDRTFRPFQEKVEVAGIFLDDVSRASSVNKFSMIFEPPQAKAITSSQGKKLEILLKGQSGGERYFTIDLATGNAL